jgi:3-phosphoshikimate 1-carboxyvinyltransferase
MLAAFGAEVVVDDLSVRLSPGPRLRNRLVEVPGDLSTAAFFLVAGALASEGVVTLRGVGVNPTRTGLLDVLDAMGADLDVTVTSTEGEPIADLTVRPSRLGGVMIAGGLVPRTIDELPILAVAASYSHGVTELRDAAELRVKESDRVRALVVELSKMGVAIAERSDGFRIQGCGTHHRLRGAHVSSWGDHRVAMALIVAGLSAEGPTVVNDIDCIATSCPEFIAACRELCGEEAVEVAA